MSKHVLLNNIDHKNMRVIVDRSMALGDNIMHAPVFPFEYRSAQADYPILFHKDENSGDWNSVALFGFERGENLFLSDSGWEQSYMPLSIERGPFLIGLQSGGQPVIHIDMDNPRISETDGQALFDEEGGNSDYLNRMAAVLDAIHQGVGQMRGFTAALEELELLEPLSVDIELNDKSKNRLVGFYAINEEKLAALPEDKLKGLQDHGFLMPIYMVLASLSQLKPLIDRKNAINSAF